MRSPQHVIPKKEALLAELNENLMLFYFELWRVSLPSAGIIQTETRVWVLFLPGESSFFMLMQLFLFNLIIRSPGLPSLFHYPTCLLWTLNPSLPCPSLLFLALLSSSLLLFSPPTSLLFLSPLFPHSKHIPLPKKIKGEANAPD